VSAPSTVSLALAGIHSFTSVRLQDIATVDRQINRMRPPCDIDPRLESFPPGSSMCFRPHKSQSNLIFLPHWLLQGVREAQDHPDVVALWDIQSDASINTRQAGVLASHGGRCHFQHEKQLTLADWDDTASSAQPYLCSIKPKSTRMRKRSLLYITELLSKALTGNTCISLSDSWMV
jgi:hypothetical protein